MALKTVESDHKKLTFKIQEKEGHLNNAHKEIDRLKTEFAEKTSNHKKLVDDLKVEYAQIIQDEKIQHQNHVLAIIEKERQKYDAKITGREAHHKIEIEKLQNQLLELTKKKQDETQKIFESHVISLFHENKEIKSALNKIITSLNIVDNSRN
jgi:uncharacterized protein involved in exopolysaccharide biosynthesis